MADRNHPSAKPAARTVLNLGNLPPKKQGFGAAAQYARTPSRVDPNNPPWPAYRGYHEFSFAHVSGMTHDSSVAAMFDCLDGLA